MALSPPRRTGLALGHTKITAALLRAGAGEEVANGAGQTPIDLARFWDEDLKVIKNYQASRASRLQKLKETA